MNEEEMQAMRREWDNIIKANRGEEIEAESTEEAPDDEDEAAEAQAEEQPESKKK